MVAVGWLCFEIEGRCSFLSCQDMKFKYFEVHQRPGLGYVADAHTYVVASLSDDGGYPFPSEVLRKKFCDPNKFTKIKTWVDDQKSQLRKEKQMKKHTGAPAKSRVKPTELQAMRCHLFFLP